jgi:hypothetical protein
VTIAWGEGGSSSHVGDVSDAQWEVFKLAFKTSGRVAVLSDEPGDDWMYDYQGYRTTGAVIPCRTCSM